MDRDFILQILAEKLAESNSELSADAFVIIIKTLHSILDNQEEAYKLLNEFLKEQKLVTPELTRIEEKLESISESIEKIIKLDSQIKSIHDDTSAIKLSNVNLNSSLGEINSNLKKSNLSLNSLIENKKAWNKFLEKVVIYIFAVGSIIGAVAIANQFGLFQIVWNLKK